MRAAQSLRSGVISTTFSGIKYSLSLLDKSYGSTEVWPDLKAIARGKGLLLSTLSGVMIDIWLYLAPYLFSKYFRDTFWYLVVYEVSSSGLISIPMSHFRNDHNIWRGSSICADMRCLTVVGVSSRWFLNGDCRSNFMAKYKSSFHYFFFLAKAPMTPSIWLKMSLYPVVTWCRVTICCFHIHRFQCWNGLNTSMTCLTMVHSSCVVKSGLYSLYFGFLSL